MQPSSLFHHAIADYFNLLQKGYPQKGILKLVGDRYKLSRDERSMLYRGVSSNTENKMRSKKLLSEQSVIGNKIFVDCLNQFFTLISYLNGNVVFISTDGLLRDASELHGKGFCHDLLTRSITLVLAYCNALELSSLVFYIDQQVSNQKKIVELLSNVLTSSTIDHKIVLSETVDNDLKKLKTGIIATSDSQIIDRSSLEIFDLAYHTLKFHFSPKFIDLRSLINKKT